MQHSPAHDALALGWLRFDAEIMPAIETERTRQLVLLGYQAGAATVLGELGNAPPEHWPALIAALSLELCDAVDRLTVAAARARREPR